MKNIKIVSCTKLNIEEFKKISLLYKYIKKTKIESKIFTTNNISLSRVYNSELYNPDNKEKILLFVHDDVLIQDLFLEEKLNYSLKEYNVVGLAGIAPPITIKSPCCWHLIGGNKPNLFGSVAHFMKDKVFNSSYGPMPSKVLMVDGLFIAVNTEKIIENNVKFSEDNPALAHFYDLDFCLECNKKNLSIGVINISVIHKGLGDSMFSNEWKIAESWFLNKWEGT